MTKSMVMVYKLICFLVMVCYTSAQGYPQPSFLAREQNITVNEGQTARLVCGVEHLGTKQIAWQRLSNNQFLTIGTLTFTDDPRFSSTHEPSSNDWVLEIANARVSDSGVYACQISSRNSIEYVIHLTVTRAGLAFLPRNQSITVALGQTAELVCGVEDLGPRTLLWKKVNEPYPLTVGTIVYAPDARYSVVHQQFSSDWMLRIRNVTYADSGEYECRIPTQVAQHSYYINVSVEVPETQPCGAGHFYCNETSVCVALSMRCNGVADCLYGEDERVCSTDHVCNGPSMVRCNSTNQCIPARWLCDGEHDCQGGEDEQNCPNLRQPGECGPGQVLCNGTVNCIQVHWLCDGDADCQGGEDEMNCTNTNTTRPSCGPNLYKCEGLQHICIHSAWRCDGDQDCPNGDDENNCTNTTAGTSTP